MDDPERAGCPPSPKTPIIASTIVEMVIERAVSIAVIAVSIPCSRNKVQEPFINGLFCHCKLRLKIFCRFCNNISSLASVFKLVSVSLCSFLCSSD